MADETASTKMLTFPSQAQAAAAAAFSGEMWFTSVAISVERCCSLADVTTFVLNSRGLCRTGALRFLRRKKPRHILPRVVLPKIVFVSKQLRSVLQIARGSQTLCSVL